MSSRKKTRKDDRTTQPRDGREEREDMENGLDASADEVVEAEKNAETADSGGGETHEETAGDAGAGGNDAKLAEMKERYVRLLAEYDNYRKRTARELQEIRSVATENLMLNLLPILDNLDRATEHRDKTETLDEYVKGIALIEDHLRKVLADAGLQAMKVVGEQFDPELHEAMLHMESEEHGSGVIVNDVEKGYMLAGKIIRHPKVIVSK